MFFQIVFVSLLQVLIGLALCFVGYHVFVLVLPVFGFFAGFLMTAQAIQELFGGGFLATTSSWVLGFVVGVIFALVAYLFYYGAVIVLAAAVGYELGVGIVSGIGIHAGFLQFLVGLILALAICVAVVFLNIPQILVIVLTALVGAGMILTGILLAFGRVSLTDLNLGIVGAFIRDSWFWSLAYIALVAVGIVAQMLIPEDYALEPYQQDQMALHGPFPTMRSRSMQTAV